jgi:large subunit ribosomal protein L3
MSEQVQEQKDTQAAAAHTIRGIIGRKVGMSQIYDRDGNQIPVTVVEAGPCTVLELNESPMKIKLGFDELKEKHLNKPQMGYFTKLGIKPLRVIQEFTCTNVKDYKVGQQLSSEVFRAGDYVDVTGTSIGKGFQGGMKRWGWSGGGASHGSTSHRRIGSAGSSADPSRVFKGHHMPGHMGDVRKTVQSLLVMAIDADKNLLLIKGAVPGSVNGTLLIKRSLKKKWKDFNAVKEVVLKKVNPMKQSKAKTGGKGK